jgi:hypothetical protein
VAPDGTAYAGLAVSVTVVDPPDGVVEIGELVIAELAVGDTVPAWPYVLPRRAETGAEWGAYARRALREQKRQAPRDAQGHPRRCARHTDRHEDRAYLERVGGTRTR